MKRLEEVQKLYELGYKQREIAEKLGIKQGTVSKDLKIIKAEIKKTNEEAVS